MKKLILTFGLVAGLTMIANAQDPHNHNPAPPASQPASNADIKMDKMEHDYGTVQQGGDGVCEFKFTNNGKDPLVITNCQGSCGCTVPECPTAPVLPGKSGTIKVKYDTNRPGPIYKTVTVMSNAKSGNVVLTIKGNVNPKPAEEALPANPVPAGAPVEKKG